MKIIKHFKTVSKHRHYVRIYCWKLGLYKQGLFHDLSKFSPIEFFESVKYYDGKISPIDVCKKKNGYSKAWLHHKGRNPHHYEYYIDNLDYGGVPLLMPKKYALELVADYIGAGKAYMEDSFSYKAEYEWWVNKRKTPLAMHEANINFVEKSLYGLMKAENSESFDFYGEVNAEFKKIPNYYDESVESYKKMQIIKEYLKEERK